MAHATIITWSRTKSIVVSRLVLALVLAATTAPLVAQTIPVFVGDALPVPLAAAGDPERGRALLAARDPANCILCHAAPGVRFAGDLAPTLEGIGTRLGPAQLRARLVDNARINPSTIMPSYHRIEGLSRVAAAYRERPILSAQQVEDLVAYLSSLK